MKDYCVRAMAGGGMLRALACTMRETVETARKNHNTSPVASAALGRLLCASALMGMMLDEEDTLTLQILCDGPVGGITACADAKGHVKGYVREPAVLLPANEKHKLDVAKAVGHGSLRVIRDMGLKEPYIGETELISGELAEDITWYYAQSEQTPTACGLGVLLSKENVVAQAGGFLIQLMPGAQDSLINVLEENLKKISSVTDFLSAGHSPEDLLNTLLAGLTPQITDTSEVSFQCDCSAARIERALLSVGRSELEDMIKEGKDVEMCCSFCGKKYIVSVDKLKEMLERAG